MCAGLEVVFLEEGLSDCWEGVVVKVLEVEDGRGLIQDHVLVGYFLHCFLSIINYILTLNAISSLIMII